MHHDDGQVIVGLPVTGQDGIAAGDQCRQIDIPNLDRMIAAEQAIAVLREAAQVTVDLVIPVGKAGLQRQVFHQVDVVTAQGTGIDARPFAMAVAMGCSLAFISPIGHPVNIMVLNPGGYSIRDYVKVGLPLTILAFLIVVFGISLFWGL